MPVLWTNETEKREILTGKRPLPPMGPEPMPIKYSLTIIIIMGFCILCKVLIGF